MKPLEKAYFKIFYHKNSKPLWFYLYKTCQDEYLADDILQESFLKFIRVNPRHLDSYRQKAYLYKIATRLLIDVKRKIKIEVFDRVPHSVSTEIEIKIDWEKLAAVKHELGVIEWHRELEPNEKKNIEYDYEVVWEKDVTISPPLP